MKKKLLVCLFLISGIAKANITLPAVIGSDMVLQQQSSVKFWGWGNPGEKVFIIPAWNSHTDSTVVTGDGKWQLYIATPKAGGPHIITIKGNNTITLTNVLIGEVWICSGQSNMEYNYNWGLPSLKDELPSLANRNIRFFNIPRTTALHPQEDCRARWTVCDSNTVKSFSAVGYYFGKKLNEDLDVPIGLISASWSGTPAEPWTPAAIVNGDPALKEAALKQNVSAGWPINPGYAFNGMIAPLTNYNIAGTIWYQGESNTKTPGTYEKLFSSMITAWRKKWSKDFPFYFVQIAPFTYGTKTEAALLREAQLKTTSLANTGMVVITDLVDDVHDIHPKNKYDVGLRLANLALQKNYGKNIYAESPFYKNIEVLKDKAIVTFNHVDGGLKLKGEKINELFIAGDDQIFYPAEGKINDGKLIVWSKKVKTPVAVRYAFSNAAIGNLFDNQGLPVSPFRTDSWNVEMSTE